MKILIVIDTDWIQRNPHQHVHLAERMVQRGHEVRVIDYEILWQKDMKKELFSKRRVHTVSKTINGINIPVIRPPILKIPVLDYISMIFTYSREIEQQICEFQPDIIMSGDILTTWIAFRIAKRHKLPTLYYAIDIVYELIPFRFLRHLGKSIEKWNISNADFVLSINEGLREYTLRMGAMPEKTAVIRGGTDLERYDPTNVTGDEIRQQYCIGKDDFVLFFMGWLYPFSGLKEVAIELAKVKDQSPNLKLFIVGDGDAYKDLQDLREELHLEDRMILTGRQPFEKIPQLIAAADVCLLPAHDNEIMHNIVPIKMYEYMAMGKPIIATKLYGLITEFGEGNGVTYVSKPENVLKKALEIFDQDILTSEGKKARNFVEHNSWENIVQNFEVIMERLICR